MPKNSKTKKDEYQDITDEELEVFLEGVESGIFEQVTGLVLGRDEKTTPKNSKQKK